MIIERNLLNLSYQFRNIHAKTVTCPIIGYTKTTNGVLHNFIQKNTMKCFTFIKLIFCGNKEIQISDSLPYQK